MISMIKRNEGYANIKLKTCRVIYSENESTTRYEMQGIQRTKKQPLDEVNSSEQVEYQGKECIEVFRGIGICYQTFAVVLLLPGTPAPRTPPNPILSHVNSF